MAILDSALRRQLAAPATFGFLVHCCFNLRDDTAADIERDWQIAPEHAYRTGLRSAPTWEGNLIAGQACLQKFGPTVLSLTPGLFCFTRKHSDCYCLEIFEQCFCHLQQWRLDLDGRLATRGIIVPEKKRGMIVGLKVFRHTRDRRPFNLATRGSYERCAA